MGAETEKSTSTTRDLYRPNYGCGREDFRARVAMHRGTHFALGTEPSDWTTIQGGSYGEKSLPSITDRAGKPINSSIQFGSTDISPEFMSTTKSVFMGHDVEKKSLGKKIVESNVVFGHENRECKSTQRGDFKATDFVLDHSSPGGRSREFVVKNNYSQKAGVLQI
eukprot:PhF_6_TR3403/c0_g1_i1/m.4896